MNERLARTQGLVREGMVHNSPFSSMHGLIDRVPCCHGVDIVWIHFVVFGLFDIGLLVEDGMEAGGSVD